MGRKASLFNKWARLTGKMYGKKVDLDPYIKLCTKTNLIWLADLNTNAKFTKYLEINKKTFVTLSEQRFLRKYAKGIIHKNEKWQIGQHQN